MPSPRPSPALDQLCSYLAGRRTIILRCWREAAAADAAQTTSHTLTRGQFNDHIPEVLDAFERKLRATPGGAAASVAGRAQKNEEVKHGLHRWQQGYRLPELMREWGHLQLCLVAELEAFGQAHPAFDRAVLTRVNRQMISLVNEAIAESAAQYERMQQAEAGGRFDDLTRALAGMDELERRRAGLIHEAVHDLRGGVLGVTLAANLLRGPGGAGPERAEFATLLHDGVQGVTAMLGDLLELARLEAGRERRELRRFNAARLLAALGRLHRPLARERGLSLRLQGPARLAVEGDPHRVRRLLQNLLLNALKYTDRGGVTLRWGAERDRWWVLVRDTGPGLRPGAGHALIDGLTEATASARESDAKTATRAGETSHVLAPARGATASARAQTGEGIGLSIVKRLCELLDASLEIASSAQTGTTFRVLLPRRYAPATRRRRTAAGRKR